MPGGPVERTIEYVAPFDRCDREADYETAWKFFEEKYGPVHPASSGTPESAPPAETPSAVKPAASPAAFQPAPAHKAAPERRTAAPETKTAPERKPAAPAPAVNPAPRIPAAPAPTARPAAKPISTTVPAEPKPVSAAPRQPAPVPAAPKQPPVRSQPKHITEGQMQLDLPAAPAVLTPKPGMEVRHKDGTIGKILKVEGTGPSAMLTIKFGREKKNYLATAIDKGTIALLP